MINTCLREKRKGSVIRLYYRSSCPKVISNAIFKKKMSVDRVKSFLYLTKTIIEFKRKIWTLTKHMCSSK